MQKPATRLTHEDVTFRYYSGGYSQDSKDCLWVPETLSWLVMRLFGIR